MVTKRQQNCKVSVPIQKQFYEFWPISFFMAYSEQNCHLFNNLFEFMNLVDTSMDINCPPPPPLFFHLPWDMIVSPKTFMRAFIMIVSPEAFLRASIMKAGSSMTAWYISGRSSISWGERPGLKKSWSLATTWSWPSRRSTWLAPGEGETERRIQARGLGTLCLTAPTYLSIL